MQYIYVQNPSAIVEKLVYFLGICSCIADVAGGEGQSYNIAAVVFYFLISENKSVIQYDRFWKFMILSILFDIIFLASWPDRGAAVQTFASFGLISKVGIAWYGKQYVRDLNSASNLGGGQNQLSNKLSADGSMEESSGSIDRENGSSAVATSAYVSSPKVSSNSYQGSYQSSL